MISYIFNGCIFEIIRWDIQEINHLQTSGFYRINVVTNKGNKVSYLSTSKRKLAASIKEQKRDIKLINRILQQKIWKEMLHWILASKIEINLINLILII